MTDISTLKNQITHCALCPRLVSWREKVARTKTKRFLTEDYWGKPVPGFGDPNARLVLVGLAPAAHGGNRTGRMFTGDRSGDWLYRALHKAGFANQPESDSLKDGLKLKDCFVTATCRCAPPQNKLQPQEIRNCRPFLIDEFRLLRSMRVVVGLGKVGFDAATQTLRELDLISFDKRPHFGHGKVLFKDSKVVLLASFHPSQQNTFTGRLTEGMFDSIFSTAARILRTKRKRGND